MYGMINKAVRGLVIDRHGEAKWQEIKRDSSLEDDDFLSMEAYDDALTYQLVASIEKVTGQSGESFLEDLGVYWIEYTAVEGYGALLASAGSTLVEFLSQLDQLHARLKLAFPELKPPRFEVKHLAEDTFELHYWSHRLGLAPLVRGLIRGLANRFEQEVTVRHHEMNGEEARNSGNLAAYEVFTVVHRPRVA